MAVQLYRIAAVLLVTLALQCISNATERFPSTKLPPLETRDMQTNPLYMQMGAAHASPDVTVSIDYAVSLVRSNLTLGFTHTHYRWQNGNPIAVAKAKELMKSLDGFHNSRIMMHGPPTIRTDATGVPLPGALDLPASDALTFHVNKITELGEGVLNFFSAPGWMKDAGTGDGNPSDRTGDGVFNSAVRPEFEDAFATLCAEIAKKYDGTNGNPKITYFTVWNEFCGFWDPATRYWDYERYTRFYNKIYRKVKAVRPDAKIGGFYQVIAGDGSAEILGSVGRDTNMPIGERTRAGIQYFLNNVVGIDFFCIDKNTISHHNPNRGTYTDVQTMKLTPVWDVLMREVIRELGDRNIPIMITEYYANISGFYNASERGAGPLGPVSGGASLEQYAACQYASIYNHIIRGSGGRETWTLLWLAPPQNIPLNIVFSDTNTPDGGEPKLHYWVMKAYKDWFNRTELVKTTSSSPDVEVIASAEAAMVINKRNSAVSVNINGKGLFLPAYGVALIDTKP